MDAAASLSTSTTPQQQQPRPMPSFYQRPLPSTCTAFSSPLGRRVFQSAMQQGGLKSFFCLVEQHTTQSEPAYCGLATLVVALNAMAIDPRQNWKKPWRWYHEELLPCCSDFDLERVKKTGMTMAGLRCLAVCQGLKVDVHYADDEKVSIDSFRDAIRQVCIESQDNSSAQQQDAHSDDDHLGTSLSQVLVVSYDRKSVGQTGSGHFSPIAAYDSVSDSVLILDTARFKYGSHWVSVSKLFEALNPIDKDTGRSRGYLLLTKDESRSISDESPNVLLQLQVNSSAEKVKEEFLSFWNDLGSKKIVSWNDFRLFWTKDDEDPGYVWYLVDPVVKPCQESEMEVVQNALNQLRLQMELHVGRCAPETPSRNCRPNLKRSVPLLHTEAIYLIFLASGEDYPNFESDDSPAGKLLQDTVKTLRGKLFT